jgi:phosphoribosylformimino-5-aminoimidazole carboxamide ribotide isomerase
VNPSMMAIPAIDLMDGKVVRLTKGDPETAKAYDYMGTPLDIAEKWKDEGAERLHIIDLDAAFGRGDNVEIIAEIAKKTDLPIQVGGGIRKIENVEKLLTNRISHVILGALAFSDPEALIQIQRKFGSAPIIVALDNKDGKVMVEGWKTPTSFGMREALEKFSKLKVETFLITSIAKDGTLSGPDLDTLSKASQYPNVNIIAAGGISTLSDLVELKRIGVEGVVIGKALYEGRFTLKQAKETLKGD